MNGGGFERRAFLKTVVAAAAAAGLGGVGPRGAAPLAGSAAGSGAVAGSAAGTAPGTRTAGAPALRVPPGFVAHGAPLLATDPLKGADLSRWGAALPRPRAVLVISAHWEAAPPTLGAVETVPLVYDFYGFPQELYRLQYPAPGAPDLARRVAALLEPGFGVAYEPTRGLDHGVWVPLVWLFPAADVPVLQLSLPWSGRPDRLLALGRALAPLADEGVLLLGSGNLVHNLGRLARADGAPPEPWAAEFDAWVAEALQTGDLDALAGFRQSAPAAALAHPTVEHYVPLLVVAGAGAALGAAASFPVTGFEFRNISRRCVQFG